MLSSGFVVKDANLRRLDDGAQKALKERVILDAVEVTRTRRKDGKTNDVPRSVQHMKAVSERVKAELAETRRSLNMSESTMSLGEGASGAKDVKGGRGHRRTKSRHDSGAGEGKASNVPSGSLKQHPFTKEVLSEEPMTASEMRAQNKQLQQRFNDLLKAYEALQEDQKMRQESYLRRERRYKNDISVLKEQVEKMVLTRDPDEGQLDRLRRINRRIQEGMEQMTGQAEALLQTKQAEMEREYRSGLQEMQKSLGESKNRNDALKMELLKTSASLEQKLDWVNEQAMRLNDKNDRLSQQNHKLKLDFGSQREDQGQMVSQLIAARRENERLRALLASNSIAASPSSSVRSASPVLGQSGGSTSVGEGARGTSPVGTKAKEGPTASLTELRKVKQDLAKERQAAQILRREHTKLLASRTELENFLRQCIDAVKDQIMRAKRVELAKRFASGQAFTLEEAGDTALADGQVAIEEFTAGDRDRVLELLLSKDRVLTLLYGRVFEPPQPGQQGVPVRQSQQVGVIDQLVADYEHQAEEKLKGVLGPLLGDDIGIYDDNSSSKGPSRPGTSMASRPSSGKANHSK